MTKVDKEYKIDIKVSARILRHMSRGIYRTPAAALKELVSNSYDAGATTVTINTGYPIFEEIIIIDNGTAMSEEKFKIIVQNIGLTDKIAGAKFKIPGHNIERATIGHYGVGFLAIGQLARKVKITSKMAQSNKGFEATIDFDQFESEKVDGIVRSIAVDEEKVEIEDRATAAQRKDNKFPIGECKIKPLKYSKTHYNKSFTKFELTEVRRSVQQKLSANFLNNYKNLKRHKEYYANFKELLQLYHNNETEIRKGQYPYEKLCWELAVYCPVVYPDINIFQRGGQLHCFKKIAENYKFELIVDGMNIHKPFEKGFFENFEYPIRDIFSWTDENYAKDKKVSGYVVYRQRIRPKTLQGILVRESGVAIGTYDLTFLEYPFHEAVKFEQLTGELFVEGLSGALNIDRNSFNETDENYLDLVKWFHNKLHDKIFVHVKTKMEKRRRETAVGILEKTFANYFANEKTMRNVKLQKLGKKTKLFTKSRDVLVINKDHPLGKVNKSTVDKLILSSILVASGFIDSDDMENILKNITTVEKSK